MIKNRYILLINKIGLEFYSDTQKRIHKIDFLPQSVYDLEVINESSLDQQISSVIETNKLVPGNILIVLTNSVLFQKEFKIEKDKKSIEDFINNIPFENTCSIIIPLTPTSERVVATNKDLYDSIKNIFVKKNFSVNGITLAALLDKNVSENSQTIISLGLKKIDSIKNDVFDINKKTDSNSDDLDTNSLDPDIEIETEKKKKITPRVIFLILVFIILILVLVGLVVKTVMYPTPVTQQSPTLDSSTNSTDENFTPTPTDTSDSISINNLAKSLSFEIQTNQQNASSAARIREGLQKEGFENISVTVNNTTQTNLITFSNTLPSTVKNRVLDYVSSELSQLTERTVSEASNDILLIIAFK